MFALILIITQIFFLIFIGGFARTTKAITTQQYYLSPNILFLLSWTLMCTPLKKLTLSTLTILILISALAFECNLLFGRFWYSVFNQFSTQYQLSIDIIVECTIAIFPILLVVLDYVGIFRYWQIYILLVPITNFMWSFNLAVLRYGLRMFDGGGGISVFLFSGVVSLVVWGVSVRQRHGKFGGYQLSTGNHLMRPDLYIRQQYYNGYTLSLYGGLIGTFILWPTTNSSTSLFSSQIKTLNPSLKQNTIFQNTAYYNTILALSVGTLCSFMLIDRDGTYERKQKIKCTIDCFINAGIVCACFVDVALNPAAVMGSALLSTIITLILYLYYQSIEMEPNKQQNISNFMIVLMYYSRALFRIVLPLLSSIIAAIVVANRSVSTVLLLDTNTYGTNIYSITAGFQIVGYFVTFGIAVLTGVLCGLVINVFLYYKNNQHLKEQQTNVAVAQQKPDLKAIQPALSTPQKVRKVSQSDLKLQKVSKPIPKQAKLSDFNFLQLDYQSSQIFPLFLQKQDKYMDEQATARKLLKQAILSHVKSNYVNMNNYISINKNKNVVTNNTMAIENGGNNGSSQSKRQTRRKLDLGIQSDIVMRNDGYTGKKMYVNHLEELTPKSGNSQIKNQTKEIVDLVNKDRSLHKERSRQAMPSFYLDHIIKSQQPHQMNRSKTQTNLQPRNSSPPKQPSGVQIIHHSKTIISHHSGINVISKNSSLPNPPSPRNVIQIKKTKSQAYLEGPVPVVHSVFPNQKKKNFQSIHVISEIDREEEEYRSRNINANTNANNNVNQRTSGNQNSIINFLSNNSNNPNPTASKIQIQQKKSTQFLKFKEAENNVLITKKQKKQIKDNESDIQDQNQHEDIIEIDSQVI